MNLPDLFWNFNARKEDNYEVPFSLFHESTGEEDSLNLK